MLNNTEPLWLPKGSVRAIVMLLMTLTVCILSVLNRSVPDIVQTAFSLCLGFYFGQRGSSVR
jgi:hypothetical protein